MRRSLLAVPSLAVLILAVAAPSPSDAAEPPFDLRALRAEWPGYARVILEKELRVTALEDDAGLRIAFRTATAVLTEADRDDLNLFVEEERPGCRVPAGIRIEVTGPDGSRQIATQDDIVRLAMDEGATWKGPRPGVRAGALIYEVFHVDYSARCFEELIGVERDLGDDEAPILSETLIVDCPDCAAVVSGGLELTVEDGRRVLRRERVLPPPPEPHVPDNVAPRFYVSTSEDPLALGRRVSDRLKVETRRWTGGAGDWAREARKAHPYVKDKALQLVRYLEDVSVWTPGAVWKRGLTWGDPTGPDTRYLEPTEWLALACALLARHGGVPVLLADLHGPRPEGVASVFDWDEYGVLLSGRGVLTSRDWEAFTPGLETSQGLAGRVAMVLEEDGPRLHMFPADPANSARTWETTVEASGTSSLLVSVRHKLGGSWGAEQSLRWLQAAHWAKKNKTSPGEAERDFSSRFFDKRRLTATTITEEDGGLAVQTAWTIQGGQRRHEGGMSVPVPVPGLDPWIRIVDEERTQPIQIDARRRSGSVRVLPIDGYTLAGVPGAEEVGAGPIRLRAAWTRDASDALLTWSLEIDDDVLPADTAGDVAAVGAAVRRLTSLSLVLVKD